MRILDRQGAGKAVLGAVAGAFLALAATACTTVPIQEMSDAQYAQARRVALKAKMLAIEAREESGGGNVSQ